MRQVRVKICGITKEDDLRIALHAGADAVGFIVGVPSSPRTLNLKEAARLIKLVPVFVKSVLVLVPDNQNMIHEMHDTLHPDVLQIHGDELLEASHLQLNGHPPIIRGFNLKHTDTEDFLSNTTAFDAILLDSYTEGRHGGTGVIHDWEQSRKVRRLIAPKPLILAGGLTPTNVKSAIATVQPYAVDVSTGVESHPGIKDPEKVFSFIKGAKEVKIRDD